MRRTIPARGRALAGAAALVALAAGPAVGQPASPEIAVFDRYQKALNAGDLEGVMALVADDALLDNPGRCHPNPCRGKAFVRAFIEATVIDVGGSITPLRIGSEPGIMDARVAFTSTRIRSTGAARIVGTEHWHVADGKITAFAFTMDLSDPDSARYIQSLQHKATVADAPSNAP